MASSGRRRPTSSVRDGIIAARQIGQFSAPRSTSKLAAIIERSEHGAATFPRPATRRSTVPRRTRAVAAESAAERGVPAARARRLHHPRLRRSPPGPSSPRPPERLRTDAAAGCDRGRRARPCGMRSRPESGIRALKARCWSSTCGMRPSGASRSAYEFTGGVMSGTGASLVEPCQRSPLSAGKLSGGTYSIQVDGKTGARGHDAGRRAGRCVARRFRR